MEALYADEDQHSIEADLNEIHVVLAVSEETTWRSMFSNNNPTKTFIVSALTLHIPFSTKSAE